jgi:hypothetical protein
LILWNTLIGLKGYSQPVSVIRLLFLFRIETPGVCLKFFAPGSWFDFMAA